MIGTVIAGRYRLDSLLGIGAMGSVYRARHVVIDRSAAIKILNADLLGRESSRGWFVREARAVNRVNHANIAEIYDLGESDDGRAYLVMELLDGVRLNDRIEEGPVDLGLALSVVEQVASALARAHGLGVIHRDLKPEHVFLVERGGRRDFVKLIDFGLARLIHDGRLAARGSVFGTPAYMSPEQALGEDAGPQADLYALGVVFYEMLTGQHPFSTEDQDQLLKCHISVAPPDPAELRGGLDPEFSRIVLKLLAKDLDHRYHDAHHLVDDCKTLQRRTLPGDSPLQLWHEPDPAPVSGSFRADGVAAVALRAALFGRMAAVVYPSGNGPRDIVDAVNSLWTLTADLSRVEGELETISRWDESLHQRSRELVAEVGRKIDELSRARSETDRMLSDAKKALERVEASMTAAKSKREESRDRVASLDGETNERQLTAALHSAAEAAAEVQRCQEEAVNLEGRIDRWELNQVRVERQIQRFRRELDQHSARIEADLERGKPRLNALGRGRQDCLKRIDDIFDMLAHQFADRPACRHLMAELQRLFPDDAVAQGELSWTREGACHE